MKKTSVTYKSSGVNIAKANTLIRGAGRLIRSTHGKATLNRKGSFGALYQLASGRYKEPVLVSSTDGVGTKLLIAQHLNRHKTVGIDLVAMNVNDILCTGADPLFFLDYIACGEVKHEVLKGVLAGIVKGCRLSGLSLIGGETAEMPGMYSKDEYDLAGFAVGIVEKKKIIDGSTIKAGDLLIGLPSSGIHSNGYSLVRKVYSAKEQKKRAAILLTPTRIYIREIGVLKSKLPIKGIAHMTGGAFYEKLTKILPAGLCFSIDRDSWNVPKIFAEIQKRGKIKFPEMYRTFNMGIGMVLVFDPQTAQKAAVLLRKKRIRFYKIGKVVKNLKKKILFE